MTITKRFVFIEGTAAVQNNMHLEGSTTAASPPPAPSTAVWHPTQLSINSEPYTFIDRSTGPCFMTHPLPTYNSPAHSQEIPSSDIVVVTNTEALPHYSAAFHRHKNHNYSISLIPMSPRMDTHAAYMQVNADRSAFQQAENLIQEVKLETSENYTITDLPPVCNMGKGDYVQHTNMLHADNGHLSSISANARGRQPCLDDITSLSGSTGCVYDSNGLETISGQLSNDQSLMLPPIASISAKPFHMQSEAEANLRNSSSSSLSTRRSSARSDNVRVGNCALSASPLGDGVVDLTSLIRCSPTSLLAFSSSSCSQASDCFLLIFVTPIQVFAQKAYLLTIMITELAFGQACVTPGLYGTNFFFLYIFMPFHCPVSCLPISCLNKNTPLTHIHLPLLLTKSQLPSSTVLLQHIYIQGC